MASGARRAFAGAGRFAAGVAWAVLLLALWFWGRDAVEGPFGNSAPTIGDVAAVGRPLGAALPPARSPLRPAKPQRVDVPALGIAAPVEARELGGAGAAGPPAHGTPDTIGWYGTGVEPGAVGTAVLVGRADTDAGPALFHGLSSARVGGKVRVNRADGSIAEFTIDDVRVLDRDRFDAKKVYGSGQTSRAELRLITRAGSDGRTAGSSSVNVVVSAYLTGVSEPRHRVTGH